MQRPRVLIAPDKFKGSLTATEAAEAIARGVLRAAPSAIIDRCPLADGGEGTVDAMLSACGGRRIVVPVRGPLPEMTVNARLGLLPDGTAVIEMAAASGLALLAPEDRNPLRTTSFGTGELLLGAAKEGAKQILIGIGGSATVDGGIGCVQGCGGRITLDDGTVATRPLVGADLPRVRSIEPPRGLPPVRVACDVTNPLCGEDGAARVFGPQKGATPEQVDRLDRWLGELAERTGTRAFAATPGAGAAGGLGYALAAFLGATVERGFDLVANALGVQRRIAWADVCFTGEGRLDRSSLSGKAPVAFAERCARAGKPCFLLAGAIEPTLQMGNSMAIADPTMPAGEAMRRAGELLEAGAERTMRQFLHSQGVS